MLTRLATPAGTPRPPPQGLTMLTHLKLSELYKQPAAGGPLHQQLHEPFWEGELSWALAPLTQVSPAQQARDAASACSHLHPMPAPLLNGARPPALPCLPACSCARWRCRSHRWRCCPAASLRSRA